MLNFKDYFIENDWQGFIRQKEFPFARQNTPLHRNVNVELDREPQYDPKNLYHVTTNLAAIKKDTTLKSRSQLGNQASGLGGGYENESPHTVSLTYNFNRALEIYEAFKFVSAICHGQVKASTIYDHFNNLQDNSYDELNNFEKALTQYVPRKYIMNGDVEIIKTYLDKKIQSPEDRYDFFTTLEKAIVEDQHANHEDHSEYDLIYNIIGFTGSFETMSRINPNNIAIIQCLIRKDANYEHKPDEVEIRVSPKDIVILRFLQPSL